MIKNLREAAARALDETKTVELPYRWKIGKMKSGTMYARTTGTDKETGKRTRHTGLFRDNASAEYYGKATRSRFVEAAKSAIDRYITETTRSK